MGVADGVELDTPSSAKGIRGFNRLVDDSAAQQRNSGGSSNAMRAVPVLVFLVTFAIGFGFAIGFAMPPLLRLLSSPSLSPPAAPPPAAPPPAAPPPAAPLPPAPLPAAPSPQVPPPPLLWPPPLWPPPSTSPPSPATPSLSPPSEPPSEPPSSPPSAVTQQLVAVDLNTAFARAGGADWQAPANSPLANPAAVGVYMSQWDAAHRAEEGTLEMWLPCQPSDWCSFSSDRFVGTVVSRHSPSLSHPVYAPFH